ncbi:MAG TPA: FAD-binding protein [Polyangiaceae bacterium]|nr:FAD-binding protein [Polyangiaceae bacterium]
MHGPTASSDREGVCGRLIRFGATLLALVGHVVLALLITAQQLWQVASRYPQALVRVWLPRPLPGSIDVTHAGHFENVTKNQFARPATIRSITEGEQIARVIREAEAATPPRRVHAVGSGHSFSDAAIADDVLLELKDWNTLLPLDALSLRSGVDRGQLVRAASGISIRALNQALKRLGLALPNMGGYDGQTLAGAISTGTHGSGRTLGPLSDMVRSLDLITEGGRALRIEPCGGPSEPCSHATLCPDIELHQDDALFHSVVVSMGCMGVVHSYVLEVCPEYYLGEHREVLEWQEVRRKLVQQEFQPTLHSLRDKPIRHFEFLVSPYERRGKRQCLVTYRWPEKEAAKTRPDRTRAFVATLFTSIREFDEIYALALTVWPRLSTWVIEREIQSLSDGLYVDESFRVLHLGDANYVPAYGSELAFALNEPDPATGLPQYVAALERLFQLAREQASRGRYHNVPVSVRFVAESPHLLSLSHGRASAIVELPMLARVPGGWDLLRFYERVLFNEFGARAHWGQANFSVGADRICKSYGAAFVTWLEQHAKLCPRGTFQNSFSERMGVRALGRAIRGQSIC